MSVSYDVLNQYARTDSSMVHRFRRHRLAHPASRFSCAESIEHTSSLLAESNGKTPKPASVAGHATRRPSRNQWSLKWPSMDSAKPQKVKAAFVVLARNENLWGLAGSIQQAEDRFNRRYNYDWVFLNDMDFRDEFKNVTSSLVSGAAYYGKIPEEHWSIPDWIDEAKAAAERKKMADAGVSYGDNLSYRHMCRFESGFFFRHPLLEGYDYYWRVEPDVKLFCDLPYDPFKFMDENDKKYGFVLAFEEYVNTIPSLWDAVKGFRDQYPHHIPANNSLALVSDDNGQTYNNCHFSRS